MTSATFIGFDSAWTDNPKTPGAICGVHLSDDGPARLYPPTLATFGEALAFIKRAHLSQGFTLVALDQPTIVPNMTGMRPVERVAASLLSWLGGGVQPSNRGRRGMFCDGAPIWRFLEALGATQDPEEARAATGGLFLIEVFPALSLASLEDAFFGRLKAPRYNPGRRRTFRHPDWVQVARAAATEAGSLGCAELAAWCSRAGKIDTPTKPDQDKLDAALCVLLALRWRLRPRSASLMLGDLVNGYMVAPASKVVRDRLTKRANLLGVPIDPP